MGKSGDPVGKGRWNHEPDTGVQELVESAQEGDSKAFERLYRLKVGQVYALCLRLVPDPGRAEILTQDVFVRVWQKLGSYRGGGAFSAWLRRVAVNVVIEDRRAEGRWTKRHFLSDEESTVERMASEQKDRTAATPVAARRAGREGRVDLAIDLERAIATLPPGARKAFVLHDVYGYRHEEIADMTGGKSGTVKAQLHRARRLLRAALSGSREAIER